MNRLALRNLFRHRVRSMITLSAIAFSTIVLVVASGFVERIFFDLRVATIETGLGHLQVVRRGWFDGGTANPYDYFLPGRSPELARIADLPHVVAVGRRLQFNGLINANDASLSFVALGVEPEHEAVVSRNIAFLSGSNLDRDDADEVVLGEGLAANFGAKVGDRVVLLVNSASGSVRAAEVTVRGIFSTQVRAFDEVAIRVPLGIAQRLLRTDGAHVWVVSLDDEKFADATAERVRALLDPARFDVVRWIDLADVYTKTKTFMSGQLGVMRVFIATIVVLGVSNMLIMNVLERTGEVGTLMALGVRRRRVVALFLVESVYLGLIGGAIGLVLAIAAAHVVSAIGVPMPPPPGRTAAYVGKVLVDLPILATAFAITLGTTVLAGLYPARKASRLVIVDALRHNR